MAESRGERSAVFSAWWKAALKAGVSVALLVFLLRRIPAADLSSLLAEMDHRLLAAAAACFVASNILASLQWHSLLSAAGIHLGALRALRYYFIGLFFNNFLPANIGGDAVKVFDVRRVGGEVYSAIAATVLDRVIGIVALCVLATGAAGILVARGAGMPYAAYLALFVVCVVGSASLFLFHTPGRVLRALARRIGVWQIGQRLTSVLDGLSAYRERRRLVGWLFALSLGIQALRVATHVLVAVALGIAFSRELFVQFYVFIPLLSLAMIPPVTINGLGVREGLAIVLFADAGIARADAFAVEFLTYAISVLVSLIGWVFFLARRNRRGDGNAV